MPEGRLFWDFIHTFVNLLWAFSCMALMMFSACKGLITLCVVVLKIIFFLAFFSAFFIFFPAFFPSIFYTDMLVSKTRGKT